MSDAQARLSAMALSSFALNGQFLKIAEQLAAPAGLTATRWQVLGAVLNEPLTQAEIARRMGITRQSVRRTASQLVDDGLLRMAENPSHRKAKLLQPTTQGLAAIEQISPQHAAFAKVLEGRLGKSHMAEISDTLAELQSVLDELS
ncbi:MarR family winged helix-turn-helix transcriptional regulator [Photobacterium atrarenae]|uniref:MarR family transcriptional regulator n=1 Tax=Photobacterium atrarenae TaxID=865757 RepID=A0ABY5GMZ0_9GAMM|nr:MarR family transcriptional regulator [Photobacterium atrarenae]UTV30479.1 MarR family transcriptional regulator [Photobacterium atrarenae]